MTLQLWGFSITAILIIAVIVIKHYYPSYKDDNPVEVLVEDLIQSETGIKVDLTPNSPEPNVTSGTKEIQNSSEPSK